MRMLTPLFEVFEDMWEQFEFMSPPRSIQPNWAVVTSSKPEPRTANEMREHARQFQKHLLEGLVNDVLRQVRTAAISGKTSATVFIQHERVMEELKKLGYTITPANMTKSNSSKEYYTISW